MSNTVRIRAGLKARSEGCRSDGFGAYTTEVQTRAKGLLSLVARNETSYGQHMYEDVA